MTSNATLPVHNPPVPMSGAAALIADHLRLRRPGLWEHNRAACELGAAVLAEIHETARGHVAALRADRSARYRDGQFVGERQFGVEDMAAVALEDEQGKAAVVAAVARVLEDGRVEPHEAAALRAEFATLKAGVQRLEHALNSAAAVGCDPRFLRRAR